MKNIVLTVVICLALTALAAQDDNNYRGMFRTMPRVYIQLVVNDKDGGELPDVINKSDATADNYILTAYISSRPHEVMSTDLTLATVPSPVNYVRISQVGNGTTVPYVTCTWLQLAGFTTNWAAGDTVRLELTHKPSGEKVSWELIIPDDNTSAIGYKQKHNPIEQIVAPPFSRKE